MGFDFRFPQITGRTEAEQLAQVKSYMHQLVEQLNWSLNSLETGFSTVVANTVKPSGNSAIEAEDAASTFNSIKSLIIKSAVIVNAYYEEINHRLEGMYVAESDFGTYAEKTDAQIEANSKTIEQRYSSLQTLLSEIETSVLETNAYIKSGALYYDDDGYPVYGLEIGQTNEEDGAEIFNKFARFTAEKLSFYDKNENEVAYISDKKLYITDAHITGSLTIGRYYCLTANGLAFKWM